MKVVFSIILLLLSMQLFSQNVEPLKSINGIYYLLEAERGIGNKQTKSKIFEFGEHKGEKLLAIAACKKCMPAVYTYKKEESREIGRTVFYNATGLYVFEYDQESFVMIMIDPKAEEWTDFYFSNFYSKNKSKVQAMSKQKIKDFIVEISD